MRTRCSQAVLTVFFVLLCGLPVSAQLRPQVTKKPRKAPVKQTPTMGTAMVNPKDGLKYEWIPPGSFMMGCSLYDTECEADEKPAHRVMISKGFWLGQTEVTPGTYKRFAGATELRMPSAPSFNLCYKRSWANDNMPIVNVSWDDAQAYCRWMGGRLPTEAEWEYAARAGSTQPQYGPLDEVAWYDKNSEGRTHEVGQKRPNAFNLYDMLGNAWEWVYDWYDGHYYQSSPERDPTGPSSGSSRVFRGGSWNSYSPSYVRVSYRQGDIPGDRYDVLIGFRCVREVSAP